MYAHELEDLVLDLEARVTALENVAPPGDTETLGQQGGVFNQPLSTQEAEGRTEAISFEEAPS